MNFLDVKTDYAFKKVFGSEQSKPILISFLNALIDFENGEKIVDLTIVDPYQIPLINGMKDSYVDVKAILSNNKRVIIEMQVLNVEGLEKRILYNAAKAYSTQLKKGASFSTLEPIIALTITDFSMFTDLKQVITYFKLIEKNTLVRYNDDIELIFIELPKFEKQEHELTTITDKWIFFIKNAGSLEYIPETLKIEEEIAEAFDIANMAGMTEEELEVQWKRQEYILMQRGAIAFAEKTGLDRGYKKGLEQGVKDGFQQGRNKGRNEGIKDTAKQLLSLGIDIETVQKATNLTEEEIRRLGQ